MKNFYRYIIFASIALSFVAGCNKMEDDFTFEEIAGNGKVTPYCLIEENVSTKHASGTMGTKSLINQTTNVDTLLCNFLRIDQKENGSFTANTDKDYITDWSEAYISEGTISTAPNDRTNNLRSISLNPEQPYISSNKELNVRMVGWYPRTCELPENAQGNQPYTQFGHSNFNSTFTQMEIEGKDYVGVKFSGLDGSKDIMVSDVKDGSYENPFNTGNYFKFNHYLSAVRIWAKAEGSAQDVGMWGDITKVVVIGQPTTCTVALPEEPDHFAEHVIWGDENAKLPVVTTPIFGENDRSDGNIEAEKYPIDLGGGSADHYLGYLMIRPNQPLRVQVHTTAGVYDVNVAAQKDETDLFNAGYIYDLHLNFKTDGTIFTFLGTEGSEKYFDLTTGELYTGGDDGEHVFNYKNANCYIIKSNPEGTEADPMYDGFCFDATVAGNGNKGLMSIGAQTLYPTNTHLEPVIADILWETSPRLITQVELLMGHVRFKVAKNPNDATKFREGNAVIAVYDNNRNILWSWHIWITDTPQEIPYTENGTEIVILDRNLGATAARWDGSETSSGNVLETYGLYYQWGRKDPSMGPPEWNYSPINMITAPYYDYASDKYDAAEVVRLAAPTLKDAVENPMYLIMPTAQTQSYYFNWLHAKIDFLWGYNTSSGRTTKTIYDPCPYGYRVSGGELGDLFSYAMYNAGAEGTFTNTEYGQIVSVNTVSGESAEKSEFYFPYTGYKGVDRGLNSLVCSWRYVDQKADYQSAVVSTLADDPEYYMHRSRIYLSKERTWKELNVEGDYSGHQIIDHTNRKTAAPVRCVRNVELNRVMAFITPSRTSVPNLNTPISFTLYSESFGVPITDAKLSIGYHLKDNPEVHNEHVIQVWNESQIKTSSLNREGFIWNPATYAFDFNDFCTRTGLDLSNNTGEFRFILYVRNKDNVNRISSTTITIKSENHISFEEWSGDNTVLTGQYINRVIRLYGDNVPEKVDMIINDGNRDIDTTNITANLNVISGTTYTYSGYCTTDGFLKFDAAGNYTVRFRVKYAEIDTPQESETRSFTVVAMNLVQVTSLDEINNNINARYVIKNVGTGAYVYDGGDPINGKDTPDNSNYFMFETQYDAYKIKIVQTQNYARLTVGWNSQSLTINGTNSTWATRFTFEFTDGSFTIYNNGYYWYMPENSSTVTVRNNSNDNYSKWEIYRVVE
ncbi:MAG: hypothetical protein IKK19_01530 [Bacteroidales bacterium]|nr:hypothetical protein [Bacteroidales bacterium]